MEDVRRKEGSEEGLETNVGIYDAQIEEIEWNKLPLHCKSE